MKWILHYSLIFTVFWSLFGQGAQEVMSIHAIDHSVEVVQNSTEQVFYADLPSSLETFREVEVEEENEDDDEHESDDHFQYAHVPSFKPALFYVSWHSLFQDTKPTKLYILFHSWKSFLFS